MWEKFAFKTSLCRYSTSPWKKSNALLFAIIVILYVLLYCWEALWYFARFGTNDISINIWTCSVIILCGTPLQEIRHNRLQINCHWHACPYRSIRKCSKFNNLTNLASTREDIEYAAMCYLRIKGKMEVMNPPPRHFLFPNIRYVLVVISPYKKYNIKTPKMER